MAQIVMAYVVMLCMTMACVAMACVAIFYTVMAYASVQEGLAIASEFASRGLRVLSMAFKIQSIEEYEIARGQF